MGWPCPCLSLQTGTMVLAVIDLLVTILNLIPLLVAGLGLMKDAKNIHERTEYGIALIIVSLIMLLIILLAFKLYSGARQKNISRVRTWLIITFVLVTLSIIGLGYRSFKYPIHTESLVVAVISILYKIYEMFVAYAFLQQMAQELYGGIGTIDVDASIAHPGVV